MHSQCIPFPSPDNMMECVEFGGGCVECGMKKAEGCFREGFFLVVN